jgi:hypothetical protein
VQRELRGVLIEGRYIGKLGRKITATAGSVNHVEPSRVDKALSPNNVRHLAHFNAIWDLRVDPGRAVLAASNAAR